MTQRRAVVVDLSQTGICILATELPPQDRRLCIGIPGSDPIHWSEVVLRSLSQPQPDRFLLRFSFRHGCPYDLFKVAVLQGRGSA